MAERNLLGIIEKVIDSQGGYLTNRFALLRPLYQLSSDRFDWVEIKEPENEFPNRGLVTWFLPPSGDAERLEGTIYEFAVAESLTFDRDNPKHDQYRSHSSILPQRPREVIDLSVEGRPFVSENVRRRLTEEGLLLDFNPPPQLYFLVDESTLIGLIKLAGKYDRWFADPQFLEGKLIDVYPFSRKKIVSLVIEEVSRYLIPPGVIIENKKTSLEWAPDDVVVKRVLKWVSDQSLTGDSITLTKAGIARAGALITNGHADQQRRQQYDRALVLLNNLEQNQQFALNIQEMALHLPAVVAQIKTAVEEEKQKACEQIQSELTAEIAQTKALRDERVSLEEEIRKIETRLEDQRKTLEIVSEAAKESLEEALTLKLEELNARPEQTLADIMIFRAALKSASFAPAVLQPSVSAPTLKLSPPIWCDVTSHIRDRKEFWTFLRNRFASQGFTEKLARQLHSIFSAGLMPILAGSEAYDALKLYASCAAGGRVLWIPISPAIIEPADLLGSVDRQIGRFRPTPNRLVDLLIHAATTDDLFVVVLDGINRASVDSYLNPLLALYEDAQKGSAQPRSLSLLHPCYTDAADPYSLAANLIWRPNVLLTGTWVGGVIGSLTPPSFWKQVILLPADQADVVNKSLAAEEYPSKESSAVSFDLWNSWRQADKCKQEGPLKRIKNLTAKLATENITLGRKLLSNYISVCQAIAGSGVDTEVAFDEAADLCFVPWLVAEGREELLEGGDSSLKQLVKQLLMT